jgi:hypothetical protein
MSWFGTYNISYNETSQEYEIVSFSPLDDDSNDETPVFDIGLGVLTEIDPKISNVSVIIETHCEAPRSSQSSSNQKPPTWLDSEVYLDFPKLGVSVENEFVFPCEIVLPEDDYALQCEKMREDCDLFLKQDYEYPDFISGPHILHMATISLLIIYIFIEIFMIRR